jgi:hypothetical protein
MIEREMELSEVPEECINCEFFMKDIGCINQDDCPHGMAFKPKILRPKRLFGS